MSDTCRVVGCRRPAELNWLGLWVCERHWRMACEMQDTQEDDTGRIDNAAIRQRLLKLRGTRKTLLKRRHAWA